MSAALTVCVIVASRLSPVLSTASATAVTVTVCAVFQSVASNSNVVSSTVNGAFAGTPTATVTVPPSGALVSTTV